VQPVADRNTGIWDHVVVSTTHQFAFNHPWVKTKGNLLSISADVTNTVGSPGSATFVFEVFDPQGAKVVNGTQACAVAGGATVVCAFEDVEIPNAQLWWPLGYGEHALYTLTLELVAEGATTASDRDELKFGVRDFLMEFDEVRAV
jgi:beta-galactosidase/beta-glucuronidase